MLLAADPAWAPRVFLSHAPARWHIETTFPERRFPLGRETSRGGCRPTVPRAAPCRFGLYTGVALLYERWPDATGAGSVAWPGKVGITFSEALAGVRRWLWSEWVGQQAGSQAAIEKLPNTLREILLAGLALAN